MTRYANVALKRTHVQAGFNYREQDPGQAEAGPSHPNGEGHDVKTTPESSAVSEAYSDMRMKKKKKASEDHVENSGEVTTTGSANGDAKNAGPHTVPGKATNTKAAKGKGMLGKKWKKDAEARKAASEQRRLRRQQDRAVDTTCFACREKGHAARHCPKTIAPSALEGQDGQRKTGKQAVGICYRCGSRKHNLSKCEKPVDPDNPLPFSSCFVCSKQGHLASSCPQNQTRGVYPNGGSCKLCGETSHLAKNCDLRQNESAAKAAFFGTGAGAGADEDDFHVFKRKAADVTREEKAEEMLRRQQAVKVGSHSGVVKAFGKGSAASRKVVTF